jgi:hypothetical protein
VSDPRPVTAVTSMDPVSDLDRLRFYRDEIKFEFSLLSMRSTMLITCQSFLIVPFAILHTANDFRAVLPPLALVSLLGFLVAFWLRRPMAAADRTIAKWLMKQRALFGASPALHELALDRDLIPGVARDLALDAEHEHSMAFSRRAPLAFMSFWCAAGLWLVVRFMVGP